MVHLTAKQLWTAQLLRLGGTAVYEKVGDAGRLGCKTRILVSPRLLMTKEKL